MYTITREAFDEVAVSFAMRMIVRLFNFKIWLFPSTESLVIFSLHSLILVQQFFWNMNYFSQKIGLMHVRRKIINFLSEICFFQCDCTFNSHFYEFLGPEKFFQARNNISVINRLQFFLVDFSSFLQQFQENFLK